MEDDELGIVYEEILSKSMPITKKRPVIIKEILDAQEEEKEQNPKKSSLLRTAPVSSVRSTLLKPKSPPKSSLVKLSAELSRRSPGKESLGTIEEEIDSPSRRKPRKKETVMTIDPQTVSLSLVQSDIDSSSENVSKRGRPPKRIEKISEEDTEIYIPEEKRGKVDDVLEKIRKSANIKLMKARKEETLNPHASFQKGDTIRNETPAITGTNLQTIKIPIHEESKMSILNFLHEVEGAEVGAEESTETIPEKQITRAPQASKKTSKIFTSVDEELERLSSQSKEEEFLSIDKPKSVKSIKSVEPEDVSIKPGKLEKSITKRVAEHEDEEPSLEDLRYEKERQLKLEKEREATARALERKSFQFGKTTRKPIQIKQVTEEGEEIEEEIDEEPREEEEIEEEPREEGEEIEEEPREEEESAEEEEIRKLLKNPSKWINTPIDEIPFNQFKKKEETLSKISKKKEIITELEEPKPLVVRKSIKKTKIKDTETGPKEAIKSSKVIEEKIEYPDDDVELVVSKPSSKTKAVKGKKAELEDEDVELVVSKPSSKTKAVKGKEPKSEDIEVVSTASSGKRKIGKYEKVDVIPILQEVEKSRLASGRGKNLYSLKELQDILRQLPGVKTTGKKEELVDRLQEELRKYGL